MNNEGNEKMRIIIYDSIGQRLGVAFVPEGNAGFAGTSQDGFIFPGAQLAGVNFSNCKLYWAMLSGANLRSANFRGADLRGASLAGADCTGADFSDANFGPGNIGIFGADLRGTNFSEAVLDGATLLSAKYDESTVFPRGFDPVLHGMEEKRGQ
jgi:uncharacterized protein YjbI with pentapeptide repeats